MKKLATIFAVIPLGATGLDPQHFVRVHRSAIVALDRVVELRDGAGGRVRLRGGTELRL